MTPEAPTPESRSTNAELPGPSGAEAVHPPVTTPAYDRDRLRDQMEILRQESAVRARLEKEIRVEHTNETAAARGEAEKAIAATKDKCAREIEASKREYAAVVRRLDETFTAEQAKIDEQRKTLTAKITRAAQQQDLKLKDDDQFEESSYREVYKEKRKDPVRHFVKAEKGLDKAAAQVEEADTRSRQFMADCGLAKPDESAPPADGIVAEDAAPSALPGAGEPLPAGGELLSLVESLRGSIVERTNSLCGLASVQRAFAGGTRVTAVTLPILLGLAAGAAGFFLTPGKLPEALTLKASAAGAAAVAVIGGGIAVALWLVARLRRTARGQATAIHADLERDIARFRLGLAAGRDHLKDRRDAQVAAIDDRFKSESEARQTLLQNRLAEVAAKRDGQLADLEAKYAEAAGTIRRKRDGGREAAEKKYPPRIAALTTACDEDVARLTRSRDERLAAADRRRDDRTREMTDNWRRVRTETAAVYDEALRIDAAAFHPWDELSRDDVPLPADPPPGLRFGSLALSLEKVPGGVSAEPALNAFGPVAWRQPAIMPFPVHASLLIKTTGDQKETSSAMMQALMLRIASGIPAGQSRFTIIDPLGLGKHFAGFMHLADYDELLVTSRIWTEPPQIEQRLADVTDQMELVIQKYLRNEYESIGSYNADAEVPEPYRFIVVANFPANFTETSARRLASIAASGARCGVFTILSVDTSARMPSNFSLAEIEKHATTLVLKDGVFTWEDPEFSKWPLAVEQAPSDEVFTSIIQRVGRAAKAAKRVEVPFDRVAPKDEDWWKGSTSSEIDVPLGPAGARKMQHMKLGKGTSQHVLIAGKTGSGKSTMMHALITNLALTYSPNEIQFYLIDFKKGVEFKVYDHYRLPHARVIAIESEREFGLSVLEQLDRELKRRGDLFRELAVQDLAGFRATGHPDPMPRVLLIIDEFQELFVEDDKLAQECSLVLDRLVRQGRAFGMHVLLGSQTLGGSYSLPRSTMGQMAVRIALQCNEADSSLILSEENSAARLLTRPGEAIYNDANGMVVGNNPFQVVWLGDERREKYLGSLRKLADARTDIPPLPRIVFDGNQAADPAGNALLSELVRSETVGGKELLAPLAWLGDAIAIKDPTAAIFRRQGGANLLVVGQREDLAVSLLAMSMVSLAAAHDPHPGGKLGRACRFVLFEPAVADEHPDLLLGQLAGHLPHEIETVGRLAVGPAMEAVAAEVKRRIDEQVLDGEAVFVVVRDLARFRELRRSDGDFGFSFGGDQKTGPAQHFVNVLKDGPTVGVHTLVWCDSLTNLMRTFERGTLKEFELRVLFQMSASDSSQLVDSPAASRLGPQRALFIHEETGTLEKFRPYAFPTPEWLAGVAAALKLRPQGTPVPRVAAKPAGTAAPAAGDAFGLKGDFGPDEFNFTKFLDDPPPAGGSPPA
jgi:S-DNA-T family DNA segregation ATPase FtsK/SpoIIIE